MKSLEFFLFYLVSIISLLKVLILWYFSTPPNCNESFLRFSSIQLVNTTYFIQKQYLLLLKNASLVLWYYSGVYQHHQSNGYTLIYLVHTILFLVIINWLMQNYFSTRGMIRRMKGSKGYSSWTQGYIYKRVSKKTDAAKLFHLLLFCMYLSLCMYVCLYVCLYGLHF